MQVLRLRRPMRGVSVRVSQAASRQPTYLRLPRQQLSIPMRVRNVGEIMEVDRLGLFTDSPFQSVFARLCLTFLLFESF